MWDLLLSVPDHCLSFYFVTFLRNDTRFENRERKTKLRYSK